VENREGVPDFLQNSSAKSQNTIEWSDEEMKRKLKSLAALAMSAAMVLSMAACGSDSGSTSAAASAAGSAAGSEAAATASGDQNLNILLSGTVNNLDPDASSWTGEYQIVTQSQASLLRIVTDDNDKDTYVEDGCESYEVSDDGLTYTFHLRENYWSDGEKVVAQQYVDAALRALNPDNGYSTTEFLPIKNAQAYYDGECDASELGVKAVDDNTVEYTLESPNSEFLYYIAYRAGYPCRQDVIDKATSTYGTNVDEMVFNGPFKVTSWVKENSVTLEKNDKYWDAANVKLSTVTMQYVAEYSTQATLFDAQQLDIVPYNDDYGADWEAQAADGKIDYVNKVGTYSDFLVFAIENGGKSGLMGNANIRQALSLAVDRQELCDTVWGRYEPAYTYVPSAVTCGGETYNTAGEGKVKDLQAQYSTDESLQELFKKGLEELGKDTDLSAVTLDFVVEADNVARQTQAEYLAQTWQNKLGIQVNVDVTTDAEERQQQMDYDVGVNGWEGGASPYNYLFVVNVPYGLKYLTGVYTNEHVNELLDQVTSITDAAKQAEMFHEIEDTILEEAGVGPLYFTDIKFFQQTYVKGIYYTNFGPEFDFSHAYIEK
jgi:oligopeptide transport system substrate-binding protein